VGDVDDVGARLHGDVGHVIASLGRRHVEGHRGVSLWTGDLQTEIRLAGVVADN